MKKKLKECHEEFFKICCKLVPSLTTTVKPIVTDEEQAYVTTVGKYLQAAPHLRCWNHLFRDAMRWLKSHGAPTQDVSVYLSDMKALFHLPTREEYTQKLQEIAQKWSAPFFYYYQNNIHPDIESIARWSIAPHGVYDPYSGVTNNQAEGINYVLKELQQWREAPVDCMVLALHYLQGYYRIEIARGQQGLGNYHLHQQFSSLVNTQPSLIPEHNIYAPEKIVERIKENIDNSLPDLPTDNKSTQELNMSTSNHQLSQRERARRVLECNKINIDPMLHTFTVWGSKQPHVVTLFPRETC